MMEQEAQAITPTVGLPGQLLMAGWTGISFNDGTISPVIGTDMKGPTTVLKSVAKVAICKALTISSTKR